MSYEVFVAHPYDLLLDKILLLLADWDAEDCMDTPFRFHMRESYALKTQSHDPDTPTYMEALSGKKQEEYF